ncbi:MAG: hypothetical protein ACI8U4_000349 [Natronomonas sp.]|jgi:hypothetical protein
MARGRRTVSERLIQRVANTTNSNPSELPVLYDHIDPDALDTLIEKMSDGEISFTYAGCEVTVESEGTIRLDEHHIGGTTDRKGVSDD